MYPNLQSPPKIQADRSKEVDRAIPFLKLFSVEEDDDQAGNGVTALDMGEAAEQRHRIRNPVALFGADVAARFSDPKCSAADRDRAKIDLTLSEVYGRFMRVDRVKRLDRATIDLDDEALSWFGRVGRPQDWPSEVEFCGPPIGCITARWLSSLIETSLANGISVNTVAKRLRHIRTMLNFANKVGLIDPVTVPVPTAEVSPRPFTDDEVEKIYNSLKPHYALQVAFVFALATGARFSDLFWIRWEQIDLEIRQVKFVAEKTGKLQVVPLADAPIRHLLRMPRDMQPFELIVDQSITASHRGDSEHVRRINKRWRELTGFASPSRLKRDWEPDCVPHPWHSARATAAMWVERVAAGMGSRLLGHVSDSRERVTRLHYLVPTVPADLRAAADAVKWPSCFLEI